MQKRQDEKRTAKDGAAGKMQGGVQEQKADIGRRQATSKQQVVNYWSDSESESERESGRAATCAGKLILRTEVACSDG
jgi:hypothetical protein